jgi:Peptidase family M23
MAEQKLVKAVKALFGPEFSVSRGYSDDHDAVDIPAKRGTKLHTIDNGRVSYAQDARTDSEAHRLKHWAKGGGNVVNIDIGNNRTIQYAHLDSINVKAGDSVHTGHLIGTVGDTGNATGPHVHFGLWKHGCGMIDPFSYLAALAGQGPSVLAMDVAVPTATIKVVERYNPPRHFTVPAGSSIRSYDPARPGTLIRDVDFELESGAEALAMVTITWPGLDPAPVPHGTFYLVASGTFAGQYIKVQQVVLDAAPTPAPGEGVAPVTSSPEATITVVEQYDPERHFTVPAGTTLRGYDPARPGEVIREVAFPDESGAHATSMVVIAWPNLDPQPVPHGTFLEVTTGAFDGLYVRAQSVVLDPVAEVESEVEPGNVLEPA